MAERIARAGMHPNADPRSEPRVAQLRPQTRDRPAQDIAHAGNCHARITGQTNRRRLRAAPEQGTGTFEHDRAAVIFDELRQCSTTIALHPARAFVRRKTQQLPR